MKWIYVTLGGVVLLGLLVVMASGLAGVAWSRASMRVRQEMAAGVVPQGDAHPVPVDPGAVPAPVARFLERSVPAGAAPPAMAHMEQAGDFQTGEGQAGWRPFTAVQTVRLHPPAFLWDARIAMAPGMTVRVRDRYLDGEGGMTAKVGALVTVMDAPPTRELAKAALLRYLAEAPWTPSGLLPGGGVTWSGVDDSTALVTLADGDLTVSATMSFDAEGDLVGVYVPDRGREVDGSFVPTPWVGRFWDHVEVVGGFRIPRQGEVAWVIDGDTVPYWRGRVTSVEYSGSR